MIAVFDTNVLVAAIITEGVCSKLLRRSRMGEFSLISCPFILNEFNRILAKKLHLSDEEISSVMQLISEPISQVIEHKIKITGICRDTDDDNIIVCAVAAKADYLVTGDSELLEIREYQGVKIVTPRDFEALFA